MNQYKQIKEIEANIGKEKEAYFEQIDKKCEEILSNITKDIEYDPKEHEEL